MASVDTGLIPTPALAPYDGDYDDDACDKHNEDDNRIFSITPPAGEISID